MSDGAKQGGSADTGEVQAQPTWVNLLIAGVTAAIVIASFLTSLLGIGAPKLDIVAAAVPVDSAWMVRGRVLAKGTGDPVLGRVWAIVTDDRGNRYAALTGMSDREGRFEVGPLARSVAPVKTVMRDITVHAVGSTVADSGRMLRGQTTLRASVEGGTRWVSLPLSALLFIVVLFVLSMVLGLAQSHPRKTMLRRGQYYGLVGLSVLFTFTMIAYLSIGLLRVSVTAAPDEVISLGFANIYHGTYVSGTAPEWLFSLTAPVAQAGGGITQGLGAPLWVLLVAVLGSALFTIRLLVKQVQDRVQFGEGGEDAFRQRLADIVRHVFSTLFAPIGAILMYQLLVLAESASAPVTVGLIILATGATADPLLARAVRMAEKLID